MVYTIIRKRHVFHALASLPTDCGTINRSLSRRGRKQLGRQPSVDSIKEAPSMEVKLQYIFYIFFKLTQFIYFDTFSGFPSGVAGPTGDAYMLSGYHAWYGRIHLPAFHSYHNFLFHQELRKSQSKKRHILRCTSSAS